MCMTCENEDLEDAMTAGEMTAALAVWKARLEAAGLGFPTDGDLTELLVLGAEIENARLRRELMGLFEREASPVVKMVSGPWIQKVEVIFNGRETR